MHHRRWVALVLFLFLSGGANSSRIAETRQREEKKEDEKKLAFSYDTNDNKRVVLGARFLEDDQLDSQEECMSNAFFLFLTNIIITAAGADSKDQKRISSANIWCRRKIKTR